MRVCGLATTSIQLKQHVRPASLRHWAREAGGKVSHRRGSESARFRLVAGHAACAFERVRACAHVCVCERACARVCARVRARVSACVSARVRAATACCWPEDEVWDARRGKQKRASPLRRARRKGARENATPGAGEKARRRAGSQGRQGVSRRRKSLQESSKESEMTERTYPLQVVEDGQVHIVLRLGRRPAREHSIDVGAGAALLPS
eukprot:1340427-Pleurochrysis_carterae.AAC.2